MNTTSNEKSYFDLHTSGIGYVQRVREVPVQGRRAQPFPCLHHRRAGRPRPGPQLPLLRRQGLGAEAKKLVQRYIGVDDPSSARWCDFASVTCGAMRTSATKGEQKGQAAASLRRDCSRPN